MSAVVVVTTGGTIASRPGADGGLRPRDPGARLVAALEDTCPAGVEVVDLLSASSFALTHRELRIIEEAVRAELRRPDVSGVVVTHGTDTLEETAALLGLVHDDDRPVVLTGAQRPPGHPEADGPANLERAVAVAADHAHRGAGVLVSLGGLVLPGLGTTKSHTTALAAFEHVGPTADRNLVTRRRPLAAPSAAFDDIRVPMIASHAGADGRQLDAALADGAAGVVLVATGLGNVTPPLLASVHRASADGVPVAVSSRVWRGPLAAVYGNGGGYDLLAAGAVLVPGLPPAQARMLVALVLSHGAFRTGADRLREVVAEWTA
jgi:L-asparaginase